MSVNKIEAIVDAIGRLNGIGNPESDAYKLRNPILQRSFARPGRHIIDDQGRRVFDSFLAGYKAATFDISLKASGHSRAGLRSTDTLANLLGCFGLKEKLGIDQVVNFLRKALSDPEISAKTPLSYFIESTENGQQDA